MRQAEIFPMLIDQNQIDNYVWFQQTLDEFKNKKKIFLNSNANFRKTLNIFTNWHNDDDFEYSKSRLLRQIHKVKRTLEENKATLQQIENNIQECEDIIYRYSIFIVSKKLI